MIRKNAVILVVLAGLLFSWGLAEAGQEDGLKVRVKVSVANIRSQPSLSSAVVHQASMGTEFQALEKRGGWFLIVVPAEGNRPEMRVYIHQSVVEIVADEERIVGEEFQEKEEKTKEESERKAARIEPVSAPPESFGEIKRQPKAEFRRIYFLTGFNMGFQEEDITRSWTEQIYYETAASSLGYGVKKGFPVSASLGFMVTPEIGLELGVDITSRDIDGTFSSSIPHPLLFESNRTGEGTGAYSLSENAVTLCAVYAARFGRMGIDVFGGGAYIMAKANVISSISFSESYPYDSISLSASSSEISKNVFGFIGGARFLFYISDGFALFGGASYLNGKAAFAPDTGIPGPEITLGGLKAGGGLKLLF